MKQKLLIGIASLILVGGAGFLAKSAQPSQPQIEPTVSPTQVPAESISYTGKEGIDALTLLKEQATVEQETSGLVVTINGRKAEASKREYWAFYVNGELAPIGPAQYKTKDGDEIEWKIETY